MYFWLFGNEESSFAGSQTLHDQRQDLGESKSHVCKISVSWLSANGISSLIQFETKCSFCKAMAKEATRHPKGAEPSVNFIK